MHYSNIVPNFSFGQGQDLPDYTLIFFVRRYFTYHGELAHLLHLCVLQILVTCPGQYDLASCFPSTRWTYRSWRGKTKCFLNVPLVCEPNENIFRTLSKYGEWKPDIAIHKIKLGNPNRGAVDSQPSRGTGWIVIKGVRWSLSRYFIPFNLNFRTLDSGRFTNVRVT